MFRCDACKKIGKSPKLLVTAIRPVTYYREYGTSSGFETAKEVKICDECLVFLKTVDLMQRERKKVYVKDHTKLPKMRKRFSDDRQEE